MAYTCISVVKPYVLKNFHFRIGHGYNHLLTICKGCCMYVRTLYAVYMGHRTLTVENFC